MIQDSTLHIYKRLLCSTLCLEVLRPTSRRGHAKSAMVAALDAVLLQRTGTSAWAAAAAANL